MSKYASKVVAQAQAWLGLKESDGSFKPIIDTYNSQSKLPRGYKMKLTDEWCAAFVSAVAIKLSYTDIIPTECSCTKMIELLKKLGAFVEDDSVTPAPGWFVFYDWQDTSGNGDNKGGSDHVGIVEKVSGNTITVIEGNYSQSVKRRNISVNGKYIRGYGVPKYDEETKISEYTTEQFVRDVQAAIGAEVDGIAGEETISKTVTVSESKNRDHAVVLAVQKRLKSLGYDGGDCGIACIKFTNAVIDFQEDNQCWVDGEITAKNKTWRKLLGME